MTNIKDFINLIDKYEYQDIDDRVETHLPLNELLNSSFDLAQWQENGVITIIIEGQHVKWSELSQFKAEFDAFIIFRKESYLRYYHPTEEQVGKFIFFSLEDLKNWLEIFPNSFDKSHPLNKNDKNIIWVNGIESEFSGCCLSVLPINQTMLPRFTELSSYIPTDQEIRSHVHFVTDGSEIITPEKFSLPYKCHEIPELRYFIYQYEILLSISLIKEYYSNKRVVISGVKRLTLSLQDSSNYSLPTESQLGFLQEAVAWVYTERTETRSLLLMDRFSLDIQDGGNFIPSVRAHIESALEQAKDRYEFVIKDRKEAHAKELSDLQIDIKSATDDHSKTVNDIIGGLYKDVLSTIFIFTIGIVSKLLGNEDLINSNTIKYLFYATASYLIISITLKIIISTVRLSLSLNDIKYWKTTTRNHMSKKAFDEHIKSRTRPYKWFYWVTVIVVFVVYLILAILVKDIPNMLKSKDTKEPPSVTVQEPSKLPEQKPSKLPEQEPSKLPEQEPSKSPEQEPSKSPEQEPSKSPEQEPSKSPEGATKH
ncbi:MAG: hypothetical protein HUJ16_04135 [Kangiella sp.]|nr:hypothetical protein [Kangiella sp.]